MLRFSTSCMGCSKIHGRIVAFTVLLLTYVSMQYIWQRRNGKYGQYKKVTVPHYNFTQKYNCPHQIVNIFDDNLYNTYEIFKHMPSTMLRNQKLSALYPKCGERIFPWFYSNEKSKTLDHHKFLFLIKSAPKHIEHRNMIRKTWGGFRRIDSGKIAVIFIIANTLNKNHDTALKLESDYYGDMLQCNFTDGYDTLHIKVISTLQWLLFEDVKYDFLAINDDDVSVNLEYYSSYYNTHYDELISTETIICGFSLTKHGHPERGNNKWSTSVIEYSGDKYPYYCNGPFYSLTRPMATALACVARVTDFGTFLWEDVLITGILREKLGSGTSNIRMPSSLFIDGHAEVPGEILRMKDSWKKWNSDSKFKEFVNKQTTKYDPFTIYEKSDDIKSALNS